MTPLDLYLETIRRDLRENRAKRKQFDGARCLIRPATWAQEAATLYHMLPSLEHLGSPAVATILLNLMEFPTVIIVDETSMESYLDIITSGRVGLTRGNSIATYQELFTKLAPTLPSLLMVEDGSRFLKVLRSQGKTVKHFFQWSVGDYPLPNLHTHLIFQPLSEENSPPKLKTILPQRT